MTRRVVKARARLLAALPLGLPAQCTARSGNRKAQASSAWQTVARWAARPNQRVGSAAAGANAQWHTVTPPTIGITGATTPRNNVLILPAASFEGFRATYFWNGGSQTIADEGNCCGGMDYGLGSTAMTYTAAATSAFRAPEHLGVSSTVVGRFLM